MKYYIQRENNIHTQASPSETVIGCSNCHAKDHKYMYHYNDVIMGAIASQITSLTSVYSIVIQTQIKENIKASRHWLCVGNSPGAGEFPAQMASYAENISISCGYITLWKMYELLWCGNWKTLCRTNQNRIRNKIIQTGIPYQVMASLISIRRTRITAQK